MKVKRLGYYSSYSKNAATYHVQIREYTLFRAIWKDVYHWYDMHIPLKVPGHKWMQKRALLKMPKDFITNGWESNWYLEWQVNQDYRSFRNTHEHSKVLATFEVTEELYNELTGLGKLKKSLGTRRTQAGSAS